MRVLVVGSEEREHALCQKILQSTLCSELFCIPGNAYIGQIAECIAVSATSIEAICKFATSYKIGLVVVGPEAPLFLGLADLLRQNGVMVFGPGKKVAQIVSDKIFARQLMKKYDILIEDHSDSPKTGITVMTDGERIFPWTPGITNSLMLYSCDQAIDILVKPTLNALWVEGIPYSGFLHTDLMFTREGPKILGYKCVADDSEAQNTLPLLETDLVEVILACVRGRGELSSIKPSWKQPLTTI